jgi:hypothetical protein
MSFLNRPLKVSFYLQACANEQAVMRCLRWRWIQVDESCGSLVSHYSDDYASET